MKTLGFEPIKQNWAVLAARFPWARDTGLLFVFDSLTNAIDYGFHILLGHWLLPGDFAIVQTLNSTLLILSTVGGVFQPVVARFIAESFLHPDHDAHDRGVFQVFMRAAVLLGAVGMLAVVVGRQVIANSLGISASMVVAVAIVCFTVLIRPILGGMLQGRGRFIILGATRFACSIGRLALLLLLLACGAGLWGAVLALPLGALVSMVVAMMAVGWGVWRSAPAVERGILSRAWHLSAAALAGFGAYMLMINVDMIWVNRSFAAEVAGSYATAVLLRRIVLLLPGAVVVVMYPRVVALVSSGRRPDRLLWGTAAVIAGSGALLALLFGLFGPEIVRLTFGAAYQGTASLLTAMAVAMVGFSLGSLWLNVFLATKPLKYVLWLMAVAALEVVLLARFHGSLAQVVAILAGAGWSLALGGLWLYVWDVRPGITEQGADRV